ncbi:MAG: M20/M25/M40 family metallo-hydrolase, partial [Maribacter sp.]|nr:M20/M25/M40 family metallo-hydrolase [Maribacter sp.]
DREQLLEILGIAQPESVGGTYQEALQYPSLNVRGLRAAWVEDEVRTIIPAEALAEIDMRLVPETPAERQIELVKEFIASQGYYILKSEPTHKERRTHTKLIKIASRVGSKPFRTDLNSQLGNWLGSAMEHVFGKGNYIRMQSTGGSQPIAPFISVLGIPAISVRIPNPDNNIHAPDENLRLGNFHEGLKMCLGILTQKYE